MMAGRSVWRRRLGWLAAAALFLAANAAFFFWYRSTAQSRQDALEARRMSLTAEVAATERESARLEAQRKRLWQVRSALEEFYGKRVGSQRQTLAPVVDEIHATLKRVGIAPSEIGYTITPVNKLPLSEMAASFSFAADYGKFKRLLDAFETGPRWIVVRDISLARRPDSPGTVQVHMTLATYFADEGTEGRIAEGPAPASPRRSRS